MVRVADGDIVEARIQLEGAAPAGSTIRQAALKRVGPPAIATDGDQEYLLPKGAGTATEGTAIAIEITREAIPGPEPWKRPLARIAETKAAPLLEGEAVPFPAPFDSFGSAGWWDLIDESRSGIIRFRGGELRIFVTPAMTLIDVDGTGPTGELSLAGVEAAARAILRHGIGGSIGIDLPTVSGKAERQALGQAFDAGFHQPFERTAVNGFGFMQVVRPRRHASLFELASDRPAFEARNLLRRAAFEPAGARRIVAHPAVIAALEAKPRWIDALARQIGGAVSLRADGGLAMSGGHAEQA